MIGERTNSFSDANYGSLSMRSYDIDGNQINAFYDSGDNLIFVVDNTINEQKPNVLLVIDSDGDKKWDEILSGQYGVDLETIRPKQDNKYQKLDIEYSGLAVYDNLIKSYNAGEDLTDDLNQLVVLRDSAARHSAMMRLNVANDTIAKTNATIVRTKETIIRLQERVKTLRAKLNATKKEIGRVSTKQSASKILKLESQIEATNEKLKRAKKRLESAQRRLETATVDAELASELLNRPATELKAIVKNNAVGMPQKYEMQNVKSDEVFIEDDTSDNISESEEIDENESDVKPLFDSDPNIINEDIAFKPISFDAPLFIENNDNTAQQTSKETTVFEDENKDTVSESLEFKPVIESMTPVINETESERKDIVPNFDEPLIVPEPEFIPEPVVETYNQDEIVARPIDNVPEQIDMKPVVETITEKSELPVVEKRIETTPIVDNSSLIQNTNEEIVVRRSRPTFVYYVLLMILVVLSVFTLWLYQTDMSDTKPELTAQTQETTENVNVVKETKPVASVDNVVKTEPSVNEESVFLDDVIVSHETVSNDNESDVDVEPVVENTNSEKTEDANASDVDTEPFGAGFVEETTQMPVVMDVVPERVGGTQNVTENESEIVSPTEQEILASKPVYEPGSKHDEMFVSEQMFVESPDVTNEYIDDANYYDEDSLLYDDEEAQYQSENMY